MQEWSNHAVWGDISWPRVKVSFQFGPYEIVALPPTKDHGASLHMELSRHGLDAFQAMTVLSRVLSLATWFEDQGCDLEPGSSGSPVPVPTYRADRTPIPAFIESWIFARGPVGDTKACQALAIYREARLLERRHSIPYAALGYYKLLETKFSDGKARAAWLSRTVAALHNSGKLKNIMDIGKFRTEIGRTPEEIVRFLYEGGRQATAHARYEESVDPDDVTQLRTLSLVLPVFRLVARELIETEFGISTNRWGL